jgi:hypothetical protein
MGDIFFGMSGPFHHLQLPLSTTLSYISPNKWSSVKPETFYKHISFGNIFICDNERIDDDLDWPKEISLALEANKMGDKRRDSIVSSFTSA